MTDIYFPKFREDLKMNDMVSIAMPASVWMGLIGAYEASTWSSNHMNALLELAADAMADPLHAKEREAEWQRRAHNHDPFAVLRQMMGQPDVPSDPGALDEG